MSFYSENLVKRATKKNVSKEEAVVKCWLNNLIASHFLSFSCEEGDYYNYSILKPATSLWHFQMKVICIKLMVWSVGSHPL